MTKRDLSIDFLRAIAIILMTITHVNALLYLGKNPVLDMLTTIGATLCFSIFLFASAYVIALKMQKHESINLKDTLNRIFEIYVVYVILGIIVTFVLEKGIGLNQIVDIALIKNVPEFTEFLIAFILFSLISHIFYKQIRYLLLSKPFILIILTILIYILGFYLHKFLSEYTHPTFIKILIENIFGYQKLHRFPLTFYLPIYVFGLILGKYISNRLLIKIITFSIAISLVLLSFKLSKWYRWPPSPLFLLYGLIFIPSVILIYRKFENFFSKNIFQIFSNIGKYPLEQFFLSTVFVFIAKAFIQPSNSEITAILVNIVILTLLILHPIVFHRKMV